MGVTSGCGEQEVGVASGSGWNLWVWLLGVVVRRYIDFLILLSLLLLYLFFFTAASLLFVLFFNVFRSCIYIYSNVYQSGPGGPHVMRKRNWSNTMTSTCNAQT